MHQDILQPTDAYVAALAWRARNNHGFAPIKAALIDMDGTLYDSMPRHAAAWDRLLTELGIDHTPDEIYLYEGMTGAAAIDMFFRRQWGRGASDDECRRLYEFKTRYFNENPVAPIMPGAEAMLKELIDNGVEPVLVTGSGQHSLIDRLNADFPGVFSPDKMVTSANVTHGKPHPEPYLMGASLAGVAPAQCIAIENAPLGVKSASRSGAFTIALTTGPIPPAELRDAGADLVLPSMQFLSDNIDLIIKNLNYQPR